MTNYKLFTNSIAAGDGVASFDVVADGILVGIFFDCRGTAAVGGMASGRFEIGFASSNGFTTNDTRNSIGTFSYAAPDPAASMQFSNSSYVPLPGVPVAMGERIYLHHIVTTGAAALATTVHLLSEDKNKQSRLRL